MRLNFRRKIIDTGSYISITTVYTVLHLMLTNGNNFQMESHRRGMLLSMLLPTVQYVGIKHPGTVHVMLTYYDIDLYFRWKIIDAGCYYRCCYLRGYQASWLAWHRHGVFSLHILINPLVPEIFFCKFFDENIVYEWAEEYL